jgi:hypothetical protein
MLLLHLFSTFVPHEVNPVVNGRREKPGSKKSALPDRAGGAPETNGAGLAQLRLLEIDGVVGLQREIDTAVGAESDDAGVHRHLNAIH